MAFGIATSLAVATQVSGSPGFADQILNARVELYACLQLLAERARFITGASWAAIALHEGHQVIYCAAAGSSAPVIGSVLEVKTLRPNQPLASDRKSLLVTITTGSKPAGFFQLVSDRVEFGDADLNSIIRLAEMVTTAIHCMEAEEQCEAEDSAPDVQLAIAASKPPTPVLWHAPEDVVSDSSKKPSVGPELTAGVYACESCGFPVSRGRTVCFDCEDRGGSSAASMVRILSAREREEESWLSAHGYTIASIVVSAIVAAIIYWLH